MSEFWCEATTREKRHKCLGWDLCTETDERKEAPREKFFPSNERQGEVLRGTLCVRCKKTDCAMVEFSYFRDADVPAWTWIPFDLSSIRCSEFENVTIKSGNRFDHRPSLCCECRWWDDGPPPEDEGQIAVRIGRCLCDPKIVGRRSDDQGCSRGEIL
jgi:hypothetical protein